LRKSRFLHFGDRQTDKQTDEQMDSIDALSRSRCRGRRLNSLPVTRLNNAKLQKLRHTSDDIARRHGSDGNQMILNRNIDNEPSGLLPS